MKTFLSLFLIIFINTIVISQPNYDESKIPVYKLPPILVGQNGTKITTAIDWWNIRRPEILKLFEEQEYGKVPQSHVNVTFKVLNEKSGVLAGSANRKEVEIEFSGNGKKLTALILIYLPAKSTGPVPVFLGYNFDGNQSVFPDPEISLTQSWVENNPMLDINNNRANELTRGASSERYPLLRILSRGYGFATIYYGDIDPDFDDGFQNGIQPLFYGADQIKPTQNEWGSIGAWAWGLSRALDYLETDHAVNSKKVIVFGHSRLGKTALWAGAMDPRFALVISNESGCGGAALSKRIFGETIETINKAFPHWFCDQFNEYNNNEESLPFDQHMLLALIAPRPVYVASAANDQWADPKGEFLSLYYAGEVYQLLGKKALNHDSMPDINQPLIEGNTGYHIRSGNHDLTFYDWERFMDFADKFLK
jgi:hypothetical protein